LPSSERHNPRETEILNEIFNAIWNDGYGCGQSPPSHLANDCTERGAIQVVHMRVRQEYGIDGWKIYDANARPPLPAQHDQTGRKDRIDEQSMTSSLYEERGMSDECDRSLVFADLRRPGGIAGEWLGVALPYEAPKLP
jgi:hypothetical protein